MKETTPLDFLPQLLFIIIIVTGIVFVVRLVRKSPNAAHIGNQTFATAFLKIIQMRKRRKVYGVLATISWYILSYIFIIMLKIPPRFGIQSLVHFGALYLVTAFWQGNASILWLRRFHLQHPGHIKFHLLLSRAAKGYGIPLTIQDSTLRTSYVMSGTQAFKRQSLFTFIFLFFGINLIPFEIRVPFAIIGIVVIFSITTFLYLSGKLGFLNLNEKHASQKVTYWLNEISERRTTFLLGILIFKCKDVFWRQIVDICLKKAAVVIIDVTEITDNIVWELKTAIAILPPENVIISYAAQNNHRGMPQNLQNELRLICGDEIFSRFQFFLYPTSRSDVKVWGGNSGLALDLSDCIAKSLAYSKTIVVPEMNCPHCGARYFESYYRPDAEVLLCNHCDGALPKLTNNGR